MNKHEEVTNYTRLTKASAKTVSSFYHVLNTKNLMITKKQEILKF